MPRTEKTNYTEYALESIGSVVPKLWLAGCGFGLPNQTLILWYSQVIFHPKQEIEHFFSMNIMSIFDLGNSSVIIHGHYHCLLNNSGSNILNEIPGESIYCTFFQVNWSRIKCVTKTGHCLWENSRFRWFQWGILANI